MSKPEFVSDSITPMGQAFDAGAIARGEPGLPTGFDWRGQSCTIAETLSAWKQSSREGSRAQGELYLRRHYYKLKMDDGAIWTVYFERQPSSKSAAKRRWFLYTREE